jgi:hypothetical protein
MKPAVLLVVQASKRLQDASDKCILPQDVLETILQEHGQTSALPSPLTFSLRSTVSGRQTHIGVQEFDAEPGTAILPAAVLENLGISPYSGNGKGDMAAHQVVLTWTVLQKGEHVLLRPLASGYSLSTDWKTALEGAFRSAYTCLTQGDVVRLRGRNERFLVDAVKPEGERGICIVDTDLEVELVPLSDQHARETLEANMNEVLPQDIVVGQAIQADGSMQYVLSSWDRSLPLYIHVDASPGTDLVVDGDPNPSLYRHIWSDLQGLPSKHVEIEPGNVALSTIDKLCLAVQGAAHSLSIQQHRDAVPEGHAACPNCDATMPKSNIFLHERHCYRKIKRCKVCDRPHAADEPHHHCSICNAAYASDEEHHQLRWHTHQHCVCGEVYPTIPSFAHHAATTCPQRLKLCHFCHLLLPQGDASSLGYLDRERGFSAHEAECGARTVQCEIDNCSRLIKLRDMASHQQYHDTKRMTRQPPRICANSLCVASVTVEGDSSLGLCAACFAPLHSTALDDPARTGLWRRVQRRILLQLLTGCHRIGCNNLGVCATAGLAQSDKSKQTLANEMLEVAKTQRRFSFCVNDAMQQKASVASLITSEGVFAESWCKRAADAALSPSETASIGTLDAVRAWLRREAPTLAEMRV